MDVKTYEGLNQRINELIGMATVPASQYPTVKPIHAKLLELAWYLDEQLEAETQEALEAETQEAKDGRE